LAQLLKKIANTARDFQILALLDWLVPGTVPT